MKHHDYVSLGVSVGNYYSDVTVKQSRHVVLRRFQSVVRCASLGSELNHKDIIKNFIHWCEVNHLHISTRETKEIAAMSSRGLDIQTVGT